MTPVRAAWRTFWFEPRSTSSLALFRIAFGLLVTAWTVSLVPDLFAFFSAGGIEPGRPVHGTGEWGLLPVSAGHAAVVVALAVTLVGAVALTLGLFTRVAAVVVFLGVLSFEHRNGLISNSGDGLIRNLAFYCALAPSGAALSLDRWRTTREAFWEFPERAPWPLRLIQIQLSVGYLSAVWHKVQGASWRDGTAVAYALRIQDVGRFPVPDVLTRSVMVTEALTFASLALELALGILVWNRVARPWLMAAGVVMHLSIEYALVVGFFGIAMVVAYTAFLAPGTAARLVLAVRDRVRNLRGVARVNDVGGQSGFGAIRVEPDEPPFHADWEARVYALNVAMLRRGVYNLDQFRDAIERMPPAAYLEASYYERWLVAIETLTSGAGTSSVPATAEHADG